MNNPDTGGLIVQLLPFFIICIPVATINYFLAQRLGKSPVLWAVLSAIPVFNFFFIWYTWYRAIFTILDRLKAIEQR